MSHRFVVALALVVVSTSAYSQQTQSQGLELNLEQFPQQTTAETAKEGGDQLQLDLKQFDSKQESKELELNLDQFGKNEQTGNGQSQPVNSENTGASQEQANTGVEDTGIGKINTTGSAATKIGDTDSSLSSDDRYLLKAGFWFLAGAMVIFLLIRGRIRKRRRQRGTRQSPAAVPYDQREHR